MAPCLRWWGSIRGPSRQLLAALYKTYRPALGSWPQFPRLPPKHVCPTSSTLMPPNGSCRQLHATARHFERLADEVSVSPLKFKFEPPCRASSSSNVGAFAACHCAQTGFRLLGETEATAQGELMEPFSSGCGFKVRLSRSASSPSIASKMTHRSEPADRFRAGNKARSDAAARPSPLQFLRS